MSVGSIQKRGNKWRVQYVDHEGKRRSESGFLTKKDATEWAQRRLRQSQGVMIGMEKITFRELCDEYLTNHQAKDLTIQALRGRLANLPFENSRLCDLRRDVLLAWRKDLAASSPNAAFDRMRAVKQVLKYAVDSDYIVKSPAAAIKNPQPDAPEVESFRDWEEVEALAAAMRPEYAFVPILGVGTGLRPQEWNKLRWEHFDWESSCINLPATVSKTGKPRRIPLRAGVVARLRPFSTGIGPLVPLDTRTFRRRVWEPALQKAGMEYRRPYAMRHTFARWSLRAGLSTFILARRMGTSVLMIDRTYGGFVMDSEDHERALLDAYDERCGWTGDRSGAQGTTREPAYTTDLHAIV